MIPVRKIFHNSKTEKVDTKSQISWSMHQINDVTNVPERHYI